MEDLFKTQQPKKNANQERQNEIKIHNTNVAKFSHLVSKCRKIVGHFRYSYKLAGLLKETQKS